jgi:biopolymer transport protein ExbD
VPSPLSDSNSLVPANKRKREEAEMDITPMIDVTFLLMIFFMVAAKIDPQAAVALPTAKHGEAIPEKNCVVIVIAEGPAHTAQIYLGAGKDADTLLESSLSLEEQEKLIGEYVDRGLNDDEKEAVLIKAESAVKNRETNRVYKAVSAVMEEGSIHIAVHEERG